LALALRYCRIMKYLPCSATLCVVVLSTSTLRISSFELRRQQAPVQGDGVAVSVNAEGLCAPTLPFENRTASPERQWLDNLLKKQRTAQQKGMRLVETDDRIELIQDAEKPKIKPTYKYLGCYSIRNEKEDNKTSETVEILKPDAPPAGMTVEKCYQFCHDAEVADKKVQGGKVQFVLLTKGKECSCLHYIDKDFAATREMAKTCTEKCAGKDSETCGGMTTHDVYVMIDCPVLPPSKVKLIKDKQQKETLEKATEAKKEADAEKAKKLGLDM